MSPMSPETIYRPAKPKDSEGIWKLWNNQHSFPLVVDTEGLRTKLSCSSSPSTENPVEIHVAEQRGNIIGVATFYDKASLYIYPEIATLVASPAFPGTGKTLLRKVEEILKARGHAAVILYPSSEEQERLEAWYASQKYSKIPNTFHWKKIL